MPADAADCKITLECENGKRGGGSLEQKFGDAVLTLLILARHKTDTLNLLASRILVVRQWHFAAARTILM